MGVDLFVMRQNLLMGIGVNNDVAIELVDEIISLTQSLEAAEKDAKRYRWLRDGNPNCNIWMKDCHDKTIFVFGTPALDSSVDRCITIDAQIAKDSDELS